MATPENRKTESQPSRNVSTDQTLELNFSDISQIKKLDDQTINSNNNIADESSLTTYCFLKQLRQCPESNNDIDWAYEIHNFKPRRGSIQKDPKSNEILKEQVSKLKEAIIRDNLVKADQTIAKQRYSSKETVKQRFSTSKGAGSTATGNSKKRTMNKTSNLLNTKKRGSSLKELLSRVDQEITMNSRLGGKTRIDFLKDVISPKKGATPKRAGAGGFLGARFGNREIGLSEPTERRTTGFAELREMGNYNTGNHNHFGLQTCAPSKRKTIDFGLGSAVGGKARDSNLHGTAPNTDREAVLSSQKAKFDGFQLRKSHKNFYQGKRKSKDLQAGTTGLFHPFDQGRKFSAQLHLGMNELREQRSKLQSYLNKNKKNNEYTGDFLHSKKGGAANQSPVSTMNLHRLSNNVSPQRVHKKINFSTSIQNEMKVGGTHSKKKRPSFKAKNPKLKIKATPSYKHLGIKSTNNNINTNNGGLVGSSTTNGGLAQGQEISHPQSKKDPAGFRKKPVKGGGFIFKKHKKQRRHLITPKAKHDQKRLDTDGRIDQRDYQSAGNELQVPADPAKLALNRLDLDMALSSSQPPDSQQEAGGGSKAAGRVLTARARSKNSSGGHPAGSAKNKKNSSKRRSDSCNDNMRKSGHLMGGGGGYQIKTLNDFLASSKVMIKNDI